MNDRRPTLEDVAARAGVGRGTVSRVVNGSAKVSARTRAVVLRAISELGYEPNEPARILAGGRAGAVALVLSEEPERRFEQPYIGQIIRGVSSAADVTRTALMLMFTQSRSDRAGVADRLRTMQVDGVLLISLLRRDPLVGLLERRGTPVVLGGRPGACHVGRAGYVDADNRGGSRRATEYLIEQGRRRIATIAGLPHSPVGVDRLNGYRDALGGRPQVVEFGDFSEISGMMAMRFLLDREPGTDAVFTASDNMASGALRELERQGRRVPDDVAVVGFEDTARDRPTRPTLTTVHQPTALMGVRMMELLSQTSDPAYAPAPIICDTDLVLRQSA